MSPPAATEPSLNQLSAKAQNPSSQALIPKEAQSTRSVGRTSASVPSPATAASNVQEKMLADWQRPIDFYGKVVDENSNVVEGANVGFGWSELPTQQGERSEAAKSDANGLFSLIGKRGPNLSVSVSKEGYYAAHRGQMSFSYGLGAEDFKADPQNPVIFKLRKKGIGESLIMITFPVGIGQIAQLRHDGTPIEIDLIKGEKVSPGNGQLKLELWRDVSNMKANVFDWKCQISVPSGGLVETPEEFAFQAPEGGYQSPIVIDMPATNQNWQGEISNKYYIQLPDGNYGRFDLYLLPYNGVFEVHSAINPSGSRNLEPAN